MRVNSTLVDDARKNPKERELKVNYFVAVVHPLVRCKEKSQGTGIERYFGLLFGVFKNSQDARKNPKERELKGEVECKHIWAVRFLMQGKIPRNGN